jgi:hypothetical protein
MTLEPDVCAMPKLGAKAEFSVRLAVMHGPRLSLSVHSAGWSIWDRAVHRDHCTLIINVTSCCMKSSN